MKTSLSRSVEDYLKGIYSLTQDGGPALTNGLAEALDVQPASVTGMIKRLAEGGWVEHEPYRGVRLTERGERKALQIVRRHRVLETYLTERLGYSWANVHEEAERLEHAVSEELIDRMADALGYPEYDPHGAPIPSRSGEVEPPARDLLSDADPGLRLVVRAVADEDAGRLRSLGDLGLTPGAHFTVESRGEDGEVRVRVSGQDELRRIAPDLTTRVYVGRPE